MHLAHDMAFVKPLLAQGDFHSARSSSVFHFED